MCYLASSQYAKLCFPMRKRKRKGQISRDLFFTLTAYRISAITIKVTIFKKLNLKCCGQLKHTQTHIIFFLTHSHVHLY